MAIFKFRAVNAKKNQPIKAQIYLGGKDRGYTKESKDSWLIVETSQSGRFEWYAKYYGEKIDSGSSTGGKILVTYMPR